MTRIFDSPDPYARRIFRAALARGIQLWDARHDTPCSCSRNWRPHDRPQEIVVLAALKACLPLCEHENVEVQLHAVSFLQEVLYSRDTLVGTVNSLLREVAVDCGSVQLHGNLFHPLDNRYVLARPETLEEDLTHYRKDQALSLFLDGYDQAYEEVSAYVGTDALKPLALFDQINDTYAKSKAPAPA